MSGKATSSANKATKAAKKTKGKALDTPLEEVSEPMNAALAADQEDDNGGDASSPEGEGDEDTEALEHLVREVMTRLLAMKKAKKKTTLPINEMSGNGINAEAPAKVSAKHPGLTPAKVIIKSENKTNCQTKNTNMVHNKISDPQVSNAAKLSACATPVKTPVKSVSRSHHKNGDSDGARDGSPISLINTPVVTKKSPVSPTLNCHSAKGTLSDRNDHKRCTSTAPEPRSAQTTLVRAESRTPQTATTCPGAPPGGAAIAVVPKN